jgi:hypothetical protein
MAFACKCDGFSTAPFTSKNGSFLELKPKSCRVFNGNTLFSGNKKPPLPRKETKAAGVGKRRCTNENHPAVLSYHPGDVKM